MKTFALLVLLSLASLAVAATKWHQLDNYTFEKYEREFGKNYATQEERNFRREIFQQNLESVKAHNKAVDAWKEGVNKFSDRTEQELKAVLGLKKHLLYATVAEREAVSVEERTYDISALPTSVDWRDKGIITAVKDQGECGSCWSFGSAETVEAHWALASGHSFVLSEQQILDCTPNTDDCGGVGGCGGGTAELAFAQLIAMGGLTSEWRYPYTSYFGQNHHCQFNSTNTPPYAKLTSYVGIASNQLAPVLDAIANIGPLAISVDASEWFRYESGVFDGCNQTNPDLDHEVQLVGYGTDPQFGDYWLVRNSWNPLWGEEGYIRLKRTATPRCGTDIKPADGDGCTGGPPEVTVCGTCGILYDAVYPVISP